MLSHGLPSYGLHSSKPYTLNPMTNLIFGLAPLNLVPTLAQVPDAATPGMETINLFQAIVIGVVQGLTEFLPISSTAHVKMIPVILGWGDPGVAFTAVIQLGSIAAILWYFWDDLREVTVGMVKATLGGKFESSEFRLGLGILLGTLPIVVVGLLIKAFIPDFDNSPLRHSSTIAIVSIVPVAIAIFANQSNDLSVMNFKT